MESLFSKVTRLMRTSENWFKSQKLREEPWKSLVKNSNMEIMAWTKGILV